MSGSSCRKRVFNSYSHKTKWMKLLVPGRPIFGQTSIKILNVHYIYIDHNMLPTISTHIGYQNHHLYIYVDMQMYFVILQYEWVIIKSELDKYRFLVGDFLGQSINYPNCNIVIFSCLVNIFSSTIIHVVDVAQTMTSTNCGKRIEGRGCQFRHIIMLG